MKDREPKLLVCARADAPWVVAGSTFDRECGVCRRAVMVAPSGQEYLEREPLAAIVCAQCVVDAIVSKKRKVEVKPAASGERLQRELAAVQPNLWGERN
jgi:hypothetical protein